MTETTAKGVPTWTLGDRLRKAREFAGMEQDELARRIGISRGTVSNYELGRGVRPPKVVVLRAWAQECGVPYSWLVDSADTERESGLHTHRHSPLLAA
jgi:transcriptional regulator with XRE-family HTH domain